MQSRHHIWAFLRPVLLAAAAATSWIVFSALGASADSGSSHSSPAGKSLVGTVGSSLNAVTSHATGQAKDVLAPVKAAVNGGLAESPSSSVASLVPAPSLTPVVHEVAGLADEVAQNVPVVKKLVPVGTVSAVTNPVVRTVDGAANSAVGTVTNVATTVLEPLDPVLAPVTGTVPVPVITPELPTLPAVPPAAQPVAADPATSSPQPSALPAVDGASPNDASPDAAAAQESAASVPAMADSPVELSDPARAHGSSLFRGLPVQLPTPSASSPESPAGPAPFEAPAEPQPVAPATTTGGAGASNGNAPVQPAWVDAHHFFLPEPGSARIQGSLLNAPAPVSFDPGSSPD
ncbi:MULTISPECIES: hypothetical protein [unclassified Pseudarthrobacter]|uniref:hypothetical protein n=1 Tax=unclassified Pseudarthrobacter TaxID=2647000 RepID=UPI0036353B85